MKTKSRNPVPPAQRSIKHRHLPPKTVRNVPRARHAYVLDDPFSPDAFREELLK